tara:strand:+ start:423 stop:611 length:189 start_codon:yes stop_codon:yes gene_type:complete
MIGNNYFNNLKQLEKELHAKIWEYEAQHSLIGVVVPLVIIDDMKEALKHISKAIDILEWDEE